MICKFTEVLNDLVDYFILGDILLLEEWKNENNLTDDLATEFTINESELLFQCLALKTILIRFCFIFLMMSRNCVRKKVVCSLERVVIH